MTDSRVKWYGQGTRSEYRLTRFGRDFPWLLDDNVGNLLVLIPESLSAFRAYVLESEEEIEDLQAALGVEVGDSWVVYDSAQVPDAESEDRCVDRRFREFTTTLSDFATTRVFSDQAWQALEACVADFPRRSADDKLMDVLAAEYRLFKMAERYLCGSLVQGLFDSVDHFIKTALTILNRRKARAGRSLENHVERLLRDADIPFDIQPDVDGRPDVVIPSKAAYEDAEYPVARLLVLGIKTTCKDRWRQVLNEATRVPSKHLLTVQPGISMNQLDEMRRAQVTLIVPQRLHRIYPDEGRSGLLTMESFIASVRRLLG